jgi:hypothetical protein
MRKSLFVTVALAAFGVLAVAGCAGGSSSVPAYTAAGSAYSMHAPSVLRHGPHYSPSLTAPHVSPLITYVPYDGGPVILTPKFYLTFWGYKKAGDPDKVEPLLIAYTKSMGGTPHNNIEVQYYQGASSGSRTYIANPANQFGGSWDDNAAIPKRPTDPQVAAEALRAVKHFGYDPDGVYVVATAHDHSESGFGPHWCSYHNLTSYNSKSLVYDNLPYMPDAGKVCGAKIIKPPAGESAVDEGVTILAGHEYGEAITDPHSLNDAAWIGPAGEIGVVCAWHGIANIAFGSKTYTAQPMVSDATESCVLTYYPSQ